MTSNELASYINHGDGKKALDQMLGEGMSAVEIGKLYDSINFYPNEDTYKYISNYFAAHKNEEALDGFFGNLNI